MPVLQSICASNFVYFYSFHGLKSVAGSSTNQNAAKDLLLASIAGTVTNFFFNHYDIFQCNQLLYLSFSSLQVLSMFLQQLHYGLLTQDSKCLVLDTEKIKNLCIEDFGVIISSKLYCNCLPRYALGFKTAVLLMDLFMFKMVFAKLYALKECHDCGVELYLL